MSHAATQLRKSRPPAATLDRRRIALIFGTAFVAAIVLAGFIISTSLPVRLTGADRAMLRQYDSIRVALSEENLAFAEKAAVTLAGSYQKRRPISVVSTMSAEAVKMARGHEEYYVVGCSMNQCQAPCVNCQMSRFSDWVQTDPAIANPFMGKASPHCGVIKQGRLTQQFKRPAST